jgi:hypothetical protein
MGKSGRVRVKGALPDNGSCDVTRKSKLVWRGCATVFANASRIAGLAGEMV